MLRQADAGGSRSGKHMRHKDGRDEPTTHTRTRLRRPYRSSFGVYHEAQAVQINQYHTISITVIISFE